MVGLQHGNDGMIAIVAVVIVMIFGFFLWMMIKQRNDEIRHHYSYQKVLTMTTTHVLLPVNETAVSYVVPAGDAYIVYIDENGSVSRAILPMEMTTICRLPSANQARLEKREKYFHRVEHDRYGEKHVKTCQPTISYTIYIPTNKSD